MRRMRALLLLALVACESTPTEAPEPTCEAPTPPAAALFPTGDNAGVFVLPDGRKITPAGQQVELGGFPADVLVVGDYALVTNAHRDVRSLQVVRRSDGALVQELTRDDAFPGFVAVGNRVYAAGGNANQVDVYDLGGDGTLTPVTSIEVGGFVTGLAFDGAGHLWAAEFLDRQLAEIDVEAGTVLQEVDVDAGPYSLVYVPETDELWASAFGDSRLLVVNASAAAQVDAPEIGGSPAELLRDPAGGRVWLSLSDDDVIVALDPLTHAETARVRLGGDTPDADGEPLPGTSPSALAYDPATDRLYAARAADNAVDVLDATTLAVLGSIPVAWYPTAMEVADGALVVTNGKGIGSGANPDGTSASDSMTGTLSIVPLDDAQLAGWTAEVAENTSYPAELYPFPCEGTFPIPRAPGDSTPIQHVVLIVRENKTYDALLGDRADGDPSLQTYPAEITPNLHALADQFTSHDNFYATSESSVQGHLALTGVFVNEYMERAWIEAYHGVTQLAGDSATGSGTPGFGTIFMHLYRNHVDFTNYGEIVGAFDEVDGESMAQFVDLKYPGGFFTLETPDVERAAYFADQVEDGVLAPFTFMLLPRDHTNGTGSGEETPESMVADNDAGTGMVIDALSHSEFWESTVVFIVEDDPQSESDHVDAHRSILLVVSPYAKREHTSSVHTSYPSLFRTIFAILGVPPLSRHDAEATPLWDAFTSEPDFTPYRFMPRTWPEENNQRRSAPEEEAAKCLDFSGPDKNPLLGELLWWRRHGHPRPGSLLAQGVTDCARLNGDGDPDGDGDAYEAAWARFEAWRGLHPGVADHITRRAPPKWKLDAAAEEAEDDDQE